MGMIWRPQAEAARTELYDRTWPDTSHAPGRLDISFTTRREADGIVAAEPVGVVRDPISARLGCIPGVAGLRARGERTAIVEEGGGMRGFGSLAVPTGGARKTAGRLGVCHTRSPRSPYIPHSPHRRDPSPEPHALTSAPEALLPNARDALHRRRPPRARACAAAIRVRLAAYRLLCHTGSSYALAFAEERTQSAACQGGGVHADRQHVVPSHAPSTASLGK